LQLIALTEPTDLATDLVFTLILDRTKGDKQLCCLSNNNE